MRSVFALVFAATLAGCSSLQPERRPGNPIQPILTGSTRYLDGNIGIEARLGPFRLHGPPGGDNDGRAREGGDRPKRRPANREDDGPGAGFTIDTMPDMDRHGSEEGDGPPSPPRWIGSASRQTIVVTIRNLGTEPLALRIEDVTSPIGNFIAFPASFTLEPGGEQVLEPMRASYPDAIEELDVVVRIGSGDRREEHTIRLKEAGSQPPPPR